ncbi:uncharacterized protein LOC106154750 [Lingula anatina]|uniref:Uncharacterized protein LOC106154750 n=1 Tax=Lingula anatina TaxID=7574 RepID=A0A1S3HF18_LINAN|nr:uncharacterized protein LOC106154750 [Lingula anatina]|eukprot:XP_013384667.1 uncharacterized protein LOC106154750 [Lingula anatina]
MGSNATFYIGFALSLLALLFNIVGFCTPNWYEKSDIRDSHGFVRCGLWEFCLDNYKNPDDLLAKPYSGCWWVYSPEYWWMRDHLMPPWFIACQYLSLIAVFVFMTASFAEGGFLFQCCETDSSALKISGGISIAAALLEGIIVTVFGTITKDGRTWMPDPDNNRVSWSFGLAVLSAFLALFSGMLMLLTRAQLSDETEAEMK